MKKQNTFAKLTAAVEELLGELQDEHGSEVQELRNRVADALQAAKHANRAAQHVNGHQSRKVGARIGQYAHSVDEYVTGYPRLAFVTGAVVFATIGYVTGMTARARA